MSTLEDAGAYLLAQGPESLLALFWFAILFEVPKYTLSFIAAATVALMRSQRPAIDEQRVQSGLGRISVIIAGHNEADFIARSVYAIREQSLKPDEIIVVSDGSVDAMPGRVRQLLSAGLIDQAHCTMLRAGKSAATNLALRLSSGDIIVNVDCDSTFDRDALKEIVRPFADPRVGGVSGNILVGNAHQSLIAGFQAIEYLISISLGKQAAAITDHVVCISGAFGAFRRRALMGIDGLDVGGGEDLDATLRLRKHGWRVRFAPDAICYTDVPATLPALLNQRFRWERDAIRLRYRKHGDMLRPLGRGFSPVELGHGLDFTVFSIVASIAFPIYVGWLVVAYGNLAPVILVAAQVGMLGFEAIAFLLAALVTPRVRALGLLPYLFGYGFYSSLGMRFLRVAAYAQEWLFVRSIEDGYVPPKVRLTRKW